MKQALVNAHIIYKVIYKNKAVYHKIYLIWQTFHDYNSFIRSDETVFFLILWSSVFFNFLKFSCHLSQLSNLMILNTVQFYFYEGQNLIIYEYGRFSKQNAYLCLGRLTCQCGLVILNGSSYSCDLFDIAQL